MQVAEKLKLEIRPSGAALGADVIGANLADPSPEEIAQIRKAVLEHVVLRFRGYRLDDLQFTDFVEKFGEIQASPDYSRSRKVYVAESPKMTVVSNVMENGQPVGDHGDGELNWHSDLGFTELPSTLTFLLARQVPPTGGNTSFANMYKAWDGLPEELRNQVAKLTLKHQCSHTAQGLPRPGYKDIETNDPREIPGPVHPIARTHPETGRKALYLGRRFGAYIPSLPLAKSEALIDTLWRYAALPENTWTQVWQTGDLIMWDNRCAMHRRDAFTGLGERRMHRLCLQGERPV